MHINNLCLVNWALNNSTITTTAKNANLTIIVLFCYPSYIVQDNAMKRSTFKGIKICVTRPTFLLATREFHNKAASWRRKLSSPLAPVDSICVARIYCTAKTQRFLYGTSPHGECNCQAWNTRRSSKPCESRTALYNMGRLQELRMSRTRTKELLSGSSNIEDAYR